ncbi:MAG: acyl carrier protein [Candidatus Omnitrophica bacterium]|nr:acyl carrier protein [Candidatus Omnitrophota bacterium]
MEQSIVERAQNVFRDIFSNPALSITPSTTAKDIEGWDSFTHITLILAMEREFKVKFGLGELQSLTSVGDLLTLIEKKNA